MSESVGGVPPAGQEQFSKSAPEKSTSTPVSNMTDGSQADLSDLDKLKQDDQIRTESLLRRLRKRLRSFFGPKPRKNEGIKVENEPPLTKLQEGQPDSINAQPSDTDTLNRRDRTAQTNTGDIPVIGGEADKEEIGFSAAPLTKGSEPVAQQQEIDTAALRELWGEQGSEIIDAYMAAKLAIDGDERYSIDNSEEAKNHRKHNIEKLLLTRELQRFIWPVDQKNMLIVFKDVDARGAPTGLDGDMTYSMNKERGLGPLAQSKLVSILRPIDPGMPRDQAIEILRDNLIALASESNVIVEVPKAQVPTEGDTFREWKDEANAAVTQILEYIPPLSDAELADAKAAGDQLRISDIENKRRYGDNAVLSERYKKAHINWRDSGGIFVRKPEGASA